MVTVGFNPSTGKVLICNSGKVSEGCCEDAICPNGPCPESVMVTVSGITLCTEPYDVCDDSFSPGWSSPNTSFFLNLGQYPYNCWRSINTIKTIGDWTYLVGCNRGLFHVLICCATASTQWYGGYNCFYTDIAQSMSAGSVTINNGWSSGDCQTGSCGDNTCNPGHCIGYGGTVTITTECSSIGSWRLGASYSAGMMARHNGSCYDCKVNHTSASSNEPGVGTDWTTYWDVW